MQSHVIQTPIASILGLLSLLRLSEETAGDRNQIMDYLEKAAGELDSVIREISHKTEETISKSKK